jgi:hypothetical protein
MRPVLRKKAQGQCEVRSAGRGAGPLRPLGFSAAIGVLAVPLVAHAETLQAPVGGKPIPLGDARVACSAANGGWALDDQTHSLRPPAEAAAIGTSVDLKIAASPAECAVSTTSLKLVATGPWPSLDPASVVFSPDQARVEARGRRLRGVALAWRNNTSSGVDICQVPKLEANAEHCTWSVGHNIPVTPGSALVWVPPGGRVGADVSTFDAEGRLGSPESFVLGVARVNLSNLLSNDASIDLSTGSGEVQLTHPESIAAVDCGEVRCEVARDRLMVRTLSSNVDSVDVKFRLRPGVFLAKGQGFETAPAAHLSVVHCPMAVISGAPLRGVDNSRTVVRIDGRCASELPDLRFVVGNSIADIVATQVDSVGTEVLLRVGNTDATTLTITAVRADSPGVAVAVAHVGTLPTPQVSTSLEIPGHPNLNFIPSNRSARVHLQTLPDHARLVPLPVPGAYSVTDQGARLSVTGDPNASGQVAMRFGYRSDALSGNFANVDLAVLTSPLERSIHEANITAPFGRSAMGPRPLAEFVCGAGAGGNVRVMPGVTAHLPYAMRDNCRIIFHRDRLAPAYGTQKMTLDVEVVDADGASRGDARVSSTIVLRAGTEPVYAWIHGVKQPFDRVIVRLSHSADEAHYVNALEVQTGVPEVKWAAVLGTGHARLYATTAVPTGLYRFGDAKHSGVLTLNFGMLSRLTWLDSDGHEGFLGLEGGIMAIGLANDKGSTGQSLTQVGAVAGLGVSVPIANRAAPTQASINLHGWFEEAISSSGPDAGRRAAFIFGPSISIGNVGANL